VLDVYADSIEMLLEEEKDETCRQEAEAVLAKLNRDSAMDSARKLLGDNQIRHAECRLGAWRLGGALSPTRGRETRHIARRQLLTYRILSRPECNSRQ
jgi:hypothetical protein